METVVDCITNLLSDRLDRAFVLERVAANLGNTSGLPSVHPASLPSEPDLIARLAAAMAHWRAEAAIRRRLRDLTQSVRSRRSSSSPKFAGIVTWADRDTRLRADALSVASTTSSISSDPPADLPFEKAADLPPELRSSLSCPTILSILESPVDLGLSKWHRRSFYTSENWAEWSRWSRPAEQHRDRLRAGDMFLDLSAMLTAPDLRNADPETAADAWSIYRRRLFLRILEALRVGFSWTDVLSRLNTTYSDPEHGYPRLVSYLDLALADEALLQYPLLHADVLRYQLDASYSYGVDKYQKHCITSEWDKATSRLPGEDVVTLAIRVVNAYLTQFDYDPTITPTTVWSHKTHVNQINKRYAACLEDDPTHPARGLSTSDHFEIHWRQLQSLHDIDDPSVPASHLDCRRIAQLRLVPHESSPLRIEQLHEESKAMLANAPAPAPASATPLLMAPRLNARERRDERRRAAGLGQSSAYSAEPPPRSYRQP